MQPSKCEESETDGKKTVAMMEATDLILEWAVVVTVVVALLALLAS